MYLHTFYAARRGCEPASFGDPEMVPFFLTAPGAEAAQRLRAKGATRSAVVLRFIARRCTIKACACLLGHGGRNTAAG